MVEETNISETLKCVILAGGASRRFGGPDKALATLDGRPLVSHVIARLLAANGALFVLRAGDAILLPSHGVDDVAWHSVLAVGDQPSLAHSYGMFARRDDYDPGGDPWAGQNKRDPNELIVQGVAMCEEPMFEELFSVIAGEYDDGLIVEL